MTLGHGEILVLFLIWFGLNLICYSIKVWDNLDVDKDLLILQKMGCWIWMIISSSTWRWTIDPKWESATMISLLKDEGLVSHIA